MTPIPRLRSYSGPAVLSYGFRPLFFLIGAVCAALAILAWLPLFYGELALATAFTAHDWQVHEMLYGYISGHGDGLSSDCDPQLDRAPNHDAPPAISSAHPTISGPTNPPPYAPRQSARFAPPPHVRSAERVGHSSVRWITTRSRWISLVDVKCR